MPDANGNLLGIQDFIANRRIRLASYLDPDVVMACPTTATDSVYVHHLSTSPDPDRTIFSIQLAASPWPDLF